MKTTVDIPKDLLEDVKKISGSRTNKQALTVALEEYVRVHRSAGLVAVLGTFTEFMDGDELAALRDDYGTH